MRATLIIMVKAPRAGAVKTRLGAGVGFGRAAALFRVLTEHTIREALKANLRVVLAVDPMSAVSGWEALWPLQLTRVPQGSGDLGVRMKRVMAAVPAGPVAIIGADAPGLRAQHVRAAFRKLKNADAVFGPAEDGGYWLIGLARRKAAPDLFSNVRWSTPHALRDTIASLPPSFVASTINQLTDVDEAKDLKHIGPFSVAR